jgi:hypothetical protein
MEDSNSERIDIIKFEDVYDSVDVYYQVTNTRIKEVISLTKDTAPTEYRYSVVTSGVELKPKDEKVKGIIFTAGNIEVFGIPALFMQDANNVISYDIELKLSLIKETGTEKFYELNVKPNAGWLKDKSRVFPIQIDPSIVKLGN